MYIGIFNAWQKILIGILLCQKVINFMTIGSMTIKYDHKIYDQ